jgi:hypothetical protein
MLERNNINNNRKRPPQPIIGDDVIAGRTRRQKRANAAKWDLQTPIIIEIVNWLDQESLMNLTLVSKQLHDIIANEPGIENKIIPVFEVSGSSTQRFFQILRNNFFNEEIKNKLQYYPRMRLNDAKDLYYDIPVHEIKQMTRDVRMDWITSLAIISPESSRTATRFPLLPYYLSDVLPKLRELDLPKTGYIHPSILRQFSNNCPLLEKVTVDNREGIRISLSGNEMSFCNNLKEIHMDHISFQYNDIRHKNKFADLKNHQEIFLFHKCCKAFERVSIRNMNYRYRFDVDEDQKFIFTQNALIKFVRNAHPSLHWFRSDLTLDNMTMLRIERPGIELLN